MRAGFPDVLDQQSGQMATYDIDMAGQAQDWAIFRIILRAQGVPATTPNMP